MAGQGGGGERERGEWLGGVLWGGGGGGETPPFLGVSGRKEEGGRGGMAGPGGDGGATAVAALLGLWGGIWGAGIAGIAGAEENSLRRGDVAHFLAGVATCLQFRFLLWCVCRQ